jgi:hypothetical protein
MAWRCSGTTNKELVANLFKRGLINSTIVRDAMEKVRYLFYERLANPIYRTQASKFQAMDFFSPLYQLEPRPLYRQSIECQICSLMITE